MKKKLSSILSWINPVILALAFLTDSFFTSLLTTLKLPNISLVGPVILSVVGMKLAESLATIIFLKSRSVRRYLMGDEDIEGYWVNIVIDVTEPDEIVAYEFCVIRYDESGVVLSGDTWNVDGAWVHNFITKGADYLDRVLEYHYRTGKDELGGYGVIKFGPLDDTPSDFVCKYVDLGDSVGSVTVGRKISDTLSGLSIEERRVIAEDFYIQYIANNIADTKAIIENRIPNTLTLVSPKET